MGGCRPQLRAQSSGRFVPARPGSAPFAAATLGGGPGGVRGAARSPTAELPGGGAQPSQVAEVPAPGWGAHGAGTRRPRTSALPHPGAATSRAPLCRRGASPQGALPPLSPLTLRAAPGCLRPPWAPPHRGCCVSGTWGRERGWEARLRLVGLPFCLGNPAEPLFLQNAVPPLASPSCRRVGGWKYLYGGRTKCRAAGRGAQQSPTARLSAWRAGWVRKALGRRRDNTDVLPHSGAVPVCAFSWGCVQAVDETRARLWDP